VGSHHVHRGVISDLYEDHRGCCAGSTDRDNFADQRDTEAAARAGGVVGEFGRFPHVTA
jgi:hypothetical protein